MSAIIRSGDVIAAEINLIKRRTAETCLQASIEIGKLLVEVKETIPHGEWGKWLEDHVDYSVSTANNLMRLFNNYGEKQQLSVFDENRMDIFGALTPSQALVLTALPEDQRVEYVQTHDVENESVREMQKQVDDLLGKNDAQKKTIEKLTKAAEKAEKQKKSDELKIGNLTKDLEQTKNELSSMEDTSKQAFERAHKAERELQELQQANSSDSDAIRQEYEEEIEGYKKRLQRAESAGTQRFAVHFELLQNEYNVLCSTLEEIRKEDPETAEKLRGALVKILSQFREGV